VVSRAREHENDYCHNIACTVQSVEYFDLDIMDLMKEYLCDLNFVEKLLAATSPVCSSYEWQWKCSWCARSSVMTSILFCKTSCESLLHCVWRLVFQMIGKLYSRQIVSVCLSKQMADRVLERRCYRPSLLPKLWPSAICLNSTRLLPWSCS